MVNKTVDDESEMDDDSAADFDKFVTSTPHKENFQSEECRNTSQCTDCFVNQVNRSTLLRWCLDWGMLTAQDSAQQAAFRWIIHHLYFVPIMI